MNKVRLLSYIGILGAMAILVQYQINVITVKNNRKEMTIASAWKEKGRPVYIDRIRSGLVNDYLKSTIKVVGDRGMQILLPANLRKHVEARDTGELLIDGRIFEGKKIRISSLKDDYTGFLTIYGESTNQLPWENGTLKIGRIPYDDGKNYSYIPTNALYNDNDGNWIFIVKNGIVKKVKVNVKKKNFDNIAIAGEFKVGDSVVVSDQRDLKTGMNVFEIEK